MVLATNLFEPLPALNPFFYCSYSQNVKATGFHLEITPLKPTRPQLEGSNDCPICMAECRQTVPITYPNYLIFVYLFVFLFFTYPAHSYKHSRLLHHSLSFTRATSALVDSTLMLGVPLGGIHQETQANNLCLGSYLICYPRGPWQRPSYLDKMFIHYTWEVETGGVLVLTTTKPGVVVHGLGRGMHIFLSVRPAWSTYQISGQSG